MSVDCQDCGAPDSDMPLDTVLTIRQWEMICPESGVLCASCIARRAAQLPGVMNLTARITFTDELDVDGPPGGHMRRQVALNHLEAAAKLTQWEDRAMLREIARVIAAMNDEQWEHYVKCAERRSAI